MYRSSRLLRPGLAALLALATASPAVADGWRATHVQGVVLSLVDHTWQDLARGEQLPGTTTLRTLGRSHLDLAGPGIELRLEHGAAAELSQAESGAAVVLHAGAITVSVADGHSATISTQSGPIRLASGAIQIWLEGVEIGIAHVRGDVEIFDGVGTCTRLASGERARLASSVVTLGP